MDYETFLLSRTDAGLDPSSEIVQFIVYVARKDCGELAASRGGIH